MTITSRRAKRIYITPRFDLNDRAFTGIEIKMLMPEHIDDGMVILNAVADAYNAKRLIYTISDLLLPPPDIEHAYSAVNVTSLIDGRFSHTFLRAKRLTDGGDPLILEASSNKKMEHWPVGAILGINNAETLRDTMQAALDASFAVANGGDAAEAWEWFRGMLVVIAI